MTQNYNQDPIVSGAFAEVEALNGSMSPEQQRLFADRLAGRYGGQTAGEVAVAASFTPSEDDYLLTVAALSDLGIRNTRRAPHTIPELEEIELSPASQSFLSAEAARGDVPELTIHLPLRDRIFGLRAGLRPLLIYFDKKQQRPTYVNKDLWDTYDAADHNRDRGRPGAKMTPVFALNDTTDPRDRNRPANDYNEPGLVYTGMTAEDQRRALAAEKQTAAGGVNIRALGVSEYIVLDAKRRITGNPPLDSFTRTHTRFVQFLGKEIGKDGHVVVPDANSPYTALSLGASCADVSEDNIGARRALEV